MNLVKSLDRENADAWAWAAARDEWLSHTARSLTAGERFVAAGLAGSFGHGVTDAVTDLAIVVDDPFSSALCDRPQTVRGGTSPQHLALFRQFGEPATIHENNHNAPAQGAFTAVLIRLARGLARPVAILPGARSSPRNGS